MLAVIDDVVEDEEPTYAIVFAVEI